MAFNIPGAAGGAATGATLGSFVPGIGSGIGAGLGALLGFLGGRQDKPTSPEIEALLQWELQRQEQANPLVESVYRLAFNRLPRGARQGLNEPSWRATGYETSPGLPGDEEDFAQSPAIRRLIKLQMARMRMADPIYQAIQRLALGRLPTGTRPRPETQPPGPNDPYEPPDIPVPPEMP